MSQAPQRSGKRSPIQQPPLPQAGDSTRDRVFGLTMDMFPWLLPPGLCLFWAGVEWSRRLFGSSPSPWLPTILSVALAALAVRKIRQVRRSMRNYALGARGERAVGQSLETLRARGYHVFHDIQDDRGNIDHILIGPAGVFAIETKTRSKRTTGRPTITYDGRKVLVDGLEPDRDPIAQALACARRLRQILKQQTGQDVTVKPVVLYPGWFVEYTTGQATDADVYVASDNYFLGSFAPGNAHAQRVLDDATINLLAAGMEREGRK
jgi:hypothetical protein